MLDDLEAQRPGTKASMLAALQNVRPSHLLDRGLWHVLGVHAASESDGSSRGAEGLVPEQRLVRG
jgi:tRNA 2-thiocytidine biosynthesis protein TtcA